MKLALSILFLLSLNYSSLLSQNIAAFIDYQNHFYVFDNGKLRQMEYLPVISYQTGDKCIAYITHNNNFKIYYHNIDYEIGSFVKDYYVTNNLVVYSSGQQLFVFEDGKKTLLSKMVGSYYYGDSIVAFYDKEKYFFQVYYDKKIYKLADGLLSNDITSFGVGQNIIGFIDNYGVFKVFYRNKIKDLYTVNSEVIAKYGLDIVAYVDPDTDNLQAFYKGEIIELETFRPKSFEVGYSKVVYVTDLGDFKLFENGETYNISSFPPDHFELYEHLLVYQQQGQFFAFYRGEEYLIENYVPSKYDCKFGSIAYIDQNGYLNLFKDGTKKILSYEKINDFDVLRNTVIYNSGMNSTKIYYNGKTYSN